MHVHVRVVILGVGAEFVIAAVDSFMNRRPGGEDISVVMTNLEQTDLPRAGVCVCVCVCVCVRACVLACVLDFRLAVCV